MQHENAKWDRALTDTWRFTIFVSSWAPRTPVNVYYTLLKARGQCTLQFWWPFCLWIWPILNIFIFFRGMAESRLSVAWALEHAVYSLCDHRCGSNETSSQYSSSSIAATSHWDSLLLLSIFSCDIWFGEPSCSQVPKPVPSAWVCSVDWICKIFLLSAFTLLPFTLRLYTCFRHEIPWVSKLTKGLCRWNAICVRHSFCYNLSPPFISG